MPKWIQGLLIIGLALIVVLGGYIGVSEIKTRTLFASFTLMDTSETVGGVYVLRNEICNLFLMNSGENQYIAFDAGQNLQDTQEALKVLGIQGEDIVTVFLTHSDYDHVGAVDAFPNATVYMPQSEVQMIDGSTNRAPFQKNVFTRSYQTVQDNEVISVGNLTITCIATPGHTPGSSSFFADGCLFVGDNLKLEDGKAITAHSNMDTALQTESLRKLASLNDVKYIFTGHYGFSDDPATAFSSFIP